LSLSLSLFSHVVPRSAAYSQLGALGKQTAAQLALALEDEAAVDVCVCVVCVCVCASVLFVQEQYKMCVILLLLGFDALLQEDCSMLLLDLGTLQFQSHLKMEERLKKFQER